MLLAIIFWKLILKDHSISITFVLVLGYSHTLRLVCLFILFPLYFAHRVVLSSWKKYLALCFMPFFLLFVEDFTHTAVLEARGVYGMLQTTVILFLSNNKLQIVHKVEFFYWPRRKEMSITLVASERFEPPLFTFKVINIATLTIQPRGSVSNAIVTACKAYICMKHKRSQNA